MKLENCKDLLNGFLIWLDKICIVIIIFSLILQKISKFILPSPALLGKDLGYFSLIWA